MKYFYLVMYLIKSKGVGISWFFSTSDTPLRAFGLKESLQYNLFTKGLSLDDIEILCAHSLSEKDYEEYFKFYWNKNLVIA